jgi:MFS family permease
MMLSNRVKGPSGGGMVRDNEYKVYGYRWVVLGVFSLMNLVSQLNWITFAPITVECIGLYKTTAFWILFLSMSFMILYLVISVPASLAIDKIGIHWGVGIGAVLMGAFGYLRAVFAHSLTLVIIAQCGLAVAQPFVLNAITKVAAEWFSVEERATAAGIATLSQFIGIVIAMAVTGPLAQSYMPAGATGLTLDAVKSMLKVYGIISVGSAILFLALAKNKPPSPPCRPVSEERFGVFKGMRHLFSQRDMLFMLALFFLGLGMFNTIITYIDLILAEKGYIAGGNEAGYVGAVMLFAGIVGAVVLPVISDKLRMRKNVLVGCLIALIPGLIGLTFFKQYELIIISSGLFGFFLLGVAPVGFQYAAEVSHPAPESISQGMILLSGQVSGILFITLMAVFSNVTIDALADVNAAVQNLSLRPFMMFFIGLAIINLILGLLLRESPMVRCGKDNSVA